MDRNALIAERAELVRKRYVRQQSNQPHAAWIAKADERINAIDAQLDAPLQGIASLAGKALADKSASPREKSLAAKVLSEYC